MIHHRKTLAVTAGALAILGITAFICCPRQPRPGGSSQSAIDWLQDLLFPRTKSTPSPRRVQLRSYGIALKAYAYEHGSYPFSTEGPAAALCGLKPFVDRLTWPLGAPVFDDEAGELKDCPYDYINIPELKPDGLSAMLVIMADKEIDEQGGRWVLTKCGHAAYIRKGNTCVVGEELPEVDGSPVSQSESNDDTPSTPGVNDTEGP